MVYTLLPRVLSPLLFAALILAAILIHSSKALSPSPDPAVEFVMENNVGEDAVPEESLLLATPHLDDMPMMVQTTDALGELTASLDPDAESSETPLVTIGSQGVFPEDYCINNSECPLDQFCKITATSSNLALSVGTCVPKGNAGAICQDSLGQCLPGLFCNSTGPNNTYNCAEKLGLGSKCLVYNGDECMNGLLCLSNNPPFFPQAAVQFNGSCQRPPMRAVGEYCNGENECAANAFCNYNESPAGLSVCRQKKGIGEVCQGNPAECTNGFCTPSLNLIARICVATRDIGDPCTSDIDCTGMDIRGDRSTSSIPDIVCNKRFPDDLFGRCLNESTLIKTLGAPCNRSMDACDTRRALSCENVDGEEVCVQMLGVGSQAICTPDSPFSSCSGRFFGDESGSRVCRQFNNENKTLTGLFECRLPLQEVHVGGLCNSESQICSEGTVCATPQNIAISQGRTQVRYCLRKIPVGADCSNMFKTTCEEGSLCINNVCTFSDGTPNATLSFAGPSDLCGPGVTCAPGLECLSLEIGTICRMPPITVGAGEECNINISPDTPSKVCEAGLACRSLEKGSVPVCAAKVGAGELCNYGSCIEGVKCLSSICTNSSGLAVGASCSLSAADGGCGTAYAVSNFELPLKCLPKEGSFACQFEQGLFGTCGAGTNGVCVEGLTCDNTQSICLVRQ